MKDQLTQAAADQPFDPDADIAFEALTGWQAGEADRDDRVFIPYLDIAAFMAAGR